MYGLVSPQFFFDGSSDIPLKLKKKLIYCLKLAFCITSMIFFIYTVNLFNYLYLYFNKINVFLSIWKSLNIKLIRTTANIERLQDRRKQLGTVIVCDPTWTWTIHLTTQGLPGVQSPQITEAARSLSCYYLKSRVYFVSSYFNYSDAHWCYSIVNL